MADEGGPAIAHAAVASASQPQHQQPQQPQQQMNEEKVEKYRRLLTLARSNLESNLALLASKDQQIAQLTAIIEEERSKRSHSSTKSAKEDDTSQPLFPRRILCRIDVEGVIWILLEYENAEDDWKSFVDELALHDFVKRISGVPLVVPPKCLTQEESARVMEESRRRVERITEEFRRYKVKMEISMKQKEAESKSMHLSLSGSNLAQATALPSSSGLAATSAAAAVGGAGLGSGTLPSVLEKALSLGHMGEQQAELTEIQKLQITMQEQEEKWKSAYEKLARELEQMKTKGAESVVAAQWRARYDGCVRDKEELQQKLSLYTQLSSEQERGMSVEQTHIELQEEYKSLRRRLYETMHEYLTKAGNDADNGHFDSFLQSLQELVEYFRVDQKDLDDGRLLHPVRSSPRAQSAHPSQRLAGVDGAPYVGKGMAESKVQYVRQMIFQYLVCREAEVKSHIESALLTLFRFTDEERAAVEVRREEDNQDALTSISSFLGSFANTSLS